MDKEWKYNHKYTRGCLPKGDIYAVESRRGKMNRFINTEITDTRWHWLYKLSGEAALGAGVLLLIAAVDFIITGFRYGAINGWLALFQNNWLVVIIKLHAGLKGVGSNLLDALNLLDVAIMAFIGMAYLGLYTALRRTSKILSLIALVQPFLGIVLFIATKSAGRSGVMGAGLVISFVMLRSHIFSKMTASLGILSSVLLLFGDISVGIAHSYIIAILTGFGYVLLTMWFFMIAQRLFQLGQGDS